MLRALMSTKPLHLDLGLLIARVGIGLSMIIFHGWGKLMGGTGRWEFLGRQMENLGIAFAPTFWGFMAAFAEVFGSALIVLGLFFRPAAVMLAGTMVVAAVMHLSLPEDHESYGWAKASHALELLAIYVAFLFTGPGRFALGPASDGPKSP